MEDTPDPLADIQIFKIQGFADGNLEVLLTFNWGKSGATSL